MFVLPVSHFRMTINVVHASENRANRLIVRTTVNMDFSGLNPTSIERRPDHITILDFESANATQSAFNVLNQNSNVVWVEFDVYLPPLDFDISFEANPSYAVGNFLSWGASHIGVTQIANHLNSTNRYNNSIVVAVLDTGVDANHPFLRGRVLPGIDIFSNSSDTRDRDNRTSVTSVAGHGTHVAGIIVDSTPGLNVQILPVRVLGEYRATALTLADGIRWAVRNGATIINMSLSIPAQLSRVEQEAIQYALDHGVTMVAAAGNNGINANTISPAGSPYVLTVSSVDSHNRPSIFSSTRSTNWGTSVNIAAPGSSINSSHLNSGFATHSGTSMAAPHVSAAVAMYKLANPNISPQIVIRNFERYVYVPQGWNTRYGTGILDLSRINFNSISSQEYFAITYHVYGNLNASLSGAPQGTNSLTDTVYRGSNASLRTASAQDWTFVAWFYDGNPSLPDYEQPRFNTVRDVRDFFGDREPYDGAIRVHLRALFRQPATGNVEPSETLIIRYHMGGEAGGNGAILSGVSTPNTSATDHVSRSSNEPLRTASLDGATFLGWIDLDRPAHIPVESATRITTMEQLRTVVADRAANTEAGGVMVNLVALFNIPQPGASPQDRLYLEFNLHRHMHLGASFNDPQWPNVNQITDITHRRAVHNLRTATLPNHTFVAWIYYYDIENFRTAPRMLNMDDVRGFVSGRQTPPGATGYTLPLFPLFLSVNAPVDTNTLVIRYSFRPETNMQYYSISGFPQPSPTARSIVDTVDRTSNAPLRTASRTNRVFRGWLMHTPAGHNYMISDMNDLRTAIQSVNAQAGSDGIVIDLLAVFYEPNPASAIGYLGLRFWLNESPTDNRTETLLWRIHSEEMWLARLHAPFTPEELNYVYDAVHGWIHNDAGWFHRVNARRIAWTAQPQEFVRRGQPIPNIPENQRVILGQDSLHSLIHVNPNFAYNNGVGTSLTHNGLPLMLANVFAFWEAN